MLWETNVDIDELDGGKWRTVKFLGGLTPVDRCRIPPRRKKKSEPAPRLEVRITDILDLNAPGGAWIWLRQKALELEANFGLGSGGEMLMVDCGENQCGTTTPKPNPTTTPKPTTTSTATTSTTHTTRGHG